MKTILIPTDFSNNARKAMNYAFNLYNKENCNFILLNTYMAPYSTPEVSSSVLQILKEESEKGLQNELELIKSSVEFTEYNVTTLSEYGPLEVNIEQLVNKKSIDIVVMGTQGSSGLEEILIGSNAYSVVNTVECPVIVVPSKAEYSVPKNILLATDYHRLKHRDVLDSLVEIAEANNSKINILNIHDKETNPSEVIEKKGLILNSVFKNINHEYFFLEDNDIEHGINKYIKENKTDLLVSIKRHHNVFEKLFKKSITKKLTMHGSVPMLILHE